MEIAACVVLVRARVVVHHVQAAMGNYVLLRILAQQLTRFLRLLLANTDYLSEPLSDTITLHASTRSGVTICLVTVSCRSPIARFCLEKLHDQFAALFWTAINPCDVQITRSEWNYEDVNTHLSPEDISHIISCSAQDLVRYGSDLSGLLAKMQTVGTQPNGMLQNAEASKVPLPVSPPLTPQPVIPEEQEEKSDRKEVPPRMRDVFWIEEKGVPKIRIADVQRYFGLVLAAAINGFNNNQGAGVPELKTLSLPALRTIFHTRGEACLRDEIEEAVSKLLLYPGGTTGIETIQHSKAISREMQDTHVAEQQVNKFLVLGGGRSGRHTFLKQMKTIYGTGFPEEERKGYTGAVLSTIFEDLAHTAEYLGCSGEIKSNLRDFWSLIMDKKMKDARVIKIGRKGVSQSEPLLGLSWEAKLKEVLQLWSHNGVLEAVTSALNLNTSKITLQSYNLHTYWLPRIPRILEHDYIPSEQDVMRAHTSSSGVTECYIEIDGNQFRLIVPEQRNERKKWIHEFENVTAVLFIADVSCSTTMVDEDMSSNMLNETTNLFGEIVNSRWFRETSVILFLNGRDVLHAQLQQNPSALAACFPDIILDKREVYSQMVEVIETQFQAENRNPDKVVYTHVTCATDTSNVAAVMNACKDIVIRRSLGEAGLIGDDFSFFSSSTPARPPPPPRSDQSSIVFPNANQPDKPSKSKKQAKGKKDKIDNVFADLENVFNGLAELVLWFETTPRIDHTHTPCLCFYHWDRNKVLRWIFVTVPVLLVLYLCLSIFAVGVLLPCVFWLLIVKTTKVERKVETGFAVRQEVLAKETWRQKACRVVSLLRRSLPMLCLLVVWPLVIVLCILPSHPDIAQPLIGSQLVFIAVLQCLGCIRSMTAWLQANCEQQRLAAPHQMDALKVKAEHAERSLLKMTSFSNVSPSSRSLFPSSSSGDSPPSSDHSHSSVSVASLPLCADTSLDTPTLNLKRPATWLALISLAAEALQLACIALPGDLSSLSSVLLIQPVNFVPDGLRSSVQAGSTAVACLCVLALISLFCLQLIKEVRIFGKLKQSGKQQAANKFFFHSFVGTILYGHGEMKGVSCLVSLAASLLSDALFLIICTNLLRAVTCANSANCWTGSHSSLAAVSLVALSFYVPLCAMIGPLLSEARDGPAKPDEIKTAQPFLAVVTISKFVLLLLVQFFGANNPEASPAASIVVCSVMLAGLIAWTLRSGSLLITTAFSPVSGLLLPLSPPTVNIWKSLSFAAGIWGGLLAVIFSLLLSSGSSKTNLVVLLVGLAVLLVAGGVWHRKWTRRELEVRRNMIALALLLQGSEEVSGDMFYRAHLGDARMGERVRQQSAADLIPGSSGMQRNATHLPPPLIGVEVDSTLQWNVVTM